MLTARHATSSDTGSNLAPFRSLRSPSTPRDRFLRFQTLVIISSAKMPPDYLIRAYEPFPTLFFVFKHFLVFSRGEGRAAIVVLAC